MRFNRAVLLRFWWVKLRALVEVRDWETLEKLAKSKKSPIGYEVMFLDILYFLLCKLKKKSIYSLL